MKEALPDELLDTLQNVQKACLEEKLAYARAAVAAATLAATGAGAAPIPFSDCALLVPTQLSMIASITVTFGFDIDKSVLAAFLSSTIGAGGATLLGRTVVSGLLKMVPGVGTVAGGAISAGTAGVLTAALGEVYIALMRMIYDGEMRIEDLNTEKGRETISGLFRTELRKR